MRTSRSSRIKKTATLWNLADHVYPVSVTAEDIAGNTATVDSTDATLGNSLKLRVRETVKPIVSILSPTSGAALTSGTPTFKVKVTDPDSGIDISTLVFKVDGTQIAASKYTSTAILYLCDSRLVSLRFIDTDYSARFRAGRYGLIRRPDDLTLEMSEVVISVREKNRMEVIIRCA